MPAVVASCMADGLWGLAADRVITQSGKKPHPLRGKVQAAPMPVMPTPCATRPLRPSPMMLAEVPPQEMWPWHLPKWSPGRPGPSMTEQKGYVLEVTDFDA
mmetsp:Transcript_121203/g.302495  ORF Transcript_121203/g.302495 Transcript_121203/m.302495 type:complete len:101 (-) Transcript_121203:1241-1543(-)